MSRPRVIGTTISAIGVAEQALGRTFPASFVRWLLINNSRSVGALTIFPVFDARDARKTWDSIVRNFEERWMGWRQNFPHLQSKLAHLLPFAECGTGDFYCFDYTMKGERGEPVVVLWSHETGTYAYVADNFSDFIVSQDC